MKLALIGPSFFGYLQRLCGVYAARGIVAEFFDERPANSVKGKLAMRFSPRSVKTRLAQDHCAALRAAVLAGGFTHALLISPEVFTAEDVTALQKAGIVVCRYGWDSVRNKPHMKSLDPLMSAIASFDPEDCAAFGYDFIPLYSDAVPDAAPPPRDLDLFYCATLHSQRPHWITEVQRVARAQNWSAEFMLFYHAKWLWALRYATAPSVWPLLRQISTKSFSRAAISNATQRARVVLDIHHHGQIGLTMRTFEALSLGAVLLTTNKAGIAGLPQPLLDRMVVVEKGQFQSAMAQALAQKSGPLSEDMLHYLSVTRFADQLLDLLEKGQAAANSAA